MKTAWINVTSADGILIDRFLITEAELRNEASRIDIVENLKRAIKQSPDELQSTLYQATGGES